MAYKEHLSSKGEGQPVSWKSAVNHRDGWLAGSHHQREWVEKQAGAHPNQTVHLVDDSGNPLSAAATEQLRRTLVTNQRRASRRQQRKQEKVERKEAVRQQATARRKAEKTQDRHRTLTVGTLAWAACIAAGISGGMGVGFLAMWILLAPVWIFLFGIIGRVMLAMIDL
jgi:hypothetical protein